MDMFSLNLVILRPISRIDNFEIDVMTPDMGFNDYVCAKISKELTSEKQKFEVSFQQ